MTAVQTFSYNPDNSLKTLGSVTVGNDNNGDITCLTGTSCGEFSYDARGHMGNLTIDALSVTYNYDAFGRRYAVSALFDGNTTTTNYQYDGLNPVASWVGTASSSATTNLVGLGLDDWFMQSASGVNESFLRDALGSTIALTDSSQTIQEQYTYDPYGNTSLSGTGGSYNDFQFTGREDDYAGLYFLRSRYYNPAIARFMSRDPAGFAGGVNMYAYAGDDPVDFSDPTGTYPGDTCGGECFNQTPNPSPFEGQGPAYGVGPGLYYPPQVTFPAPVPTIGGLLNDLVQFYDGGQNGGLGLNFGGNVVPVQQLGKGFPGPGWSRNFDRSYRRNDTPALTLKPDLHRQKAIGPSFLLTWANETRYNQNVRLSGGEG